MNDAGKTGSLMTPPVAFPDRDLLQVVGIDGETGCLSRLIRLRSIGHKEGDSIGSGFVYRGKMMPQMRGKYIFNDMTTGRIFYVDLNENDCDARDSVTTRRKFASCKIMYKKSGTTHPAKSR